jgi:glycosyltransferase involved in cell wall biosynthesis
MSFHKLYLATYLFSPLQNTEVEREFAFSFLKNGFDVNVITCNNPFSGEVYFVDPDLEEEAIPFSIKHIHIANWLNFGKILHKLKLISCEHSNWKFFLKRHLIKQLKKEPGIVFALCPPVATLSAAADACVKTGSKLVVHFQQLPPKENSSHWKRMEEALKNASLISVTNFADHDILAEMLPSQKDKIVITEKGWTGSLPPVKIMPRYSKVEAVWLIDSNEDMETVVRTVGLIKKHHPDIVEKLMISVYAEATPEIRKNIFPIIEEDFFEFGGFLPSNVRQKTILDCDFVITCPKDGGVIPQSFYTAIACGKPILTNSQGILKRLISLSQCGIAAEGSKPSFLAGSIIGLIDKREYIETLSANAIKIRAKFSLEEQISLLCNRLKKII